MKLGYTIEEIMNSIGNDSSHLHKLYVKLTTGQPPMSASGASHPHTHTLTSLNSSRNLCFYNF